MPDTNQPRHRLGRHRLALMRRQAVKIRTAVVIGALAVGGSTAALLAPGAQAATHTHARMILVQQDTFHNRLTIHGWAYSTTRPKSTSRAKIYGDGHYIGHVVAHHPDYKLNRVMHLSGRHAFVFSMHTSRRFRHVTVVPAGTHVAAASHGVRHVQPAAVTRVISVAARYVGHARYVYGGSSPKHGFDCSGYTRYVFAAAHVASLPHSAEGQRRMHRMHRIAASARRPGDLVFYLSGGHAYHVAIYGGHGTQYSATDPKQGIRHQRIWSHNVRYGRLAA